MQNDPLDIFPHLPTLDRVIEFSATTTTTTMSYTDEALRQVVSLVATVTMKGPGKRNKNLKEMIALVYLIITLDLMWEDLIWTTASEVRDKLGHQSSQRPDPMILCGDDVSGESNNGTLFYLPKCDIIVK